MNNPVDFPAMNRLSGHVIYAEAKDDTSFNKCDQLRQPLMDQSGKVKEHQLINSHYFDIDSEVFPCSSESYYVFTFRVKRKSSTFDDFLRTFFHSSFMDLHVHSSILNYVSVTKGTVQEVDIPAYIDFPYEPKDSIKLRVDRAFSGRYSIKYVRHPTSIWNVVPHFDEGENEITRALEALVNSNRLLPHNA
ncbi:hypothetical protein D5R81_16165 [Parashewanella spongiae]|uniref:Uncharacterized protein n=1 Tax=Parashewanella spongiae TaxID=342950 RepID=A0A3A6TJ72_9GAMM|nr:hypothetical protein [Parashewanella spongiae]MCL1079580.1 hypothetical protein [Parashewanella spongiae]RJY07281.1 hypothetical protein D5R81_16165 [Parashewanella spongiae]